MSIACFGSAGLSGCSTLQEESARKQPGLRQKLPSRDARAGLLSYLRVPTAARAVADWTAASNTLCLRAATAEPGPVRNAKPRFQLQPGSQSSLLRVAGNKRLELECAKSPALSPAFAWKARVVQRVECSLQSPCGMPHRSAGARASAISGKGQSAGKCRKRFSSFLGDHNGDLKTWSRQVQGQPLTLPQTASGLTGHRRMLR